MVRKKLSLPQRNWTIYIYFEVDSRLSGEILFLMEGLGADRYEMGRALKNLRSDSPNVGLTFSSLSDRASVLVIGRTTSAKEFANTFDHEKGHLVKHICVADKVDPYSEEAEYLAGDVGALLFPYAEKYLCDECRAKA